MNIEQFYTLLGLYYDTEVGLAIVTLPFILLAFYAVLRKTPTKYRLLKHLLITLVFEHTVLGYGLCTIQPVMLPHNFGGFVQGPWRLNNQYGFHMAMSICSSALFIDMFLTVFGFYVQTAALDLNEPPFLKWLQDKRWRSPMFFTLVILSPYITVIVFINWFRHDQMSLVLNFTDPIMLHIQETEPSFLSMPLDLHSTKSYMVLSAFSIFTSIMLNVYLGYRTIKLVRQNIEMCNDIARNAQLQAMRFLVGSVVERIFFWHIPVILITFGYLAGTWAYYIAAPSAIVLSTYSIVRVLKVLYCIPFYHHWMRRTFWRKPSLIWTFSSETSGQWDMK